MAKKAVEIARATKISRKKDVALIHGEIQEGQHKSSYQKDPFKIPLENKLDVLVQASNVLKEQSPLIKAAYTYYRGYREDKFFMSSEGAEINQQITWCGGGISGPLAKRFCSM